MNKPCYTISEFCRDHGGISRVFFYKLRKQGKAPRITKLGTRTVITAEAAADWLKQMEMDSNPSWLDSPISGSL